MVTGAEIGDFEIEFLGLQCSDSTGVDLGFRDLRPAYPPQWPFLRRKRP